MERNVKYLLLRKTDVLKTSIFSERNLKKCTNFEEQKGTKYIREKVYVDIVVFNFLSPTKLFVWEIKDFYQSSFRNEVDFWDIMDVSHNILAKSFGQKTETMFCR